MAGHGADGATASFIAPEVEPQTIHAILIATDAGQPPPLWAGGVQVMPKTEFCCHRLCGQDWADS